MSSQFELQTDFKPIYSSARIMSWKSKRTGLQLVLINQATPIVNGYFVVASEIDNDSGAPHTLEHLVFMGSKKYPYKGLLDMIGNKAFSSTNAWTATDQTVYTLETAGWDGFKMLLPVYLDHVLHPTLTDSACLTEVYHIDGNAEEKGVVFSEMQGVENLSYSLMALESQKLRFSPESGYSSETGGLMAALRVLTNEQIREFHKLRYRPDNLCVIVNGAVEPDELLDIVSKFDDELELSSTPSKRPFVDSPRDEPPKTNIHKKIKFPEFDESFGEVQLSWFGPPANDTVNGTALDILGMYLTLSGAGKLQQAIVDIEEPLATDVSFYTDDFITTGINIFLSGVPSDNLQEVELKVMEVLTTQVKNLDLKLLRDCVERRKSRFILSTEQDLSTFAYIAIDNFLYGSSDGQDLVKWIKTVDEFVELASWGSLQWQNLIKEYFLDNNRVVVYGEPSKDLYEKLKQENEERLKKYKETYGTAGLEELQSKLDKAQAENNRPVPAEVLDSFQMPDPENIRFIHTKTARTAKAIGSGTSSANEQLQKLIDNDSGSNFPLYIHYEQFESQFVSVRVYLSSFVVEVELLPYIEVIISELFSLPMELEDGTKLTYDEVAREVKVDTLQNTVSTSLSTFFEYVVFEFKAKLDKYDRVVEWIRRAFWATIFDKDRIKVLIEKHLNGLAEEKRDGSSILHSSIVQSTLTKRSLKFASDHLQMEESYRCLQRKIANGDFDEIAADLEKLRKQLFKIDNMRVLVRGNVEKLQNPASAWELLIDASKQTVENLVSISHSSIARSPKGISLDHEAVITPMAGTESSFLSLVGRCFTDYNHEDLAALMVASSYLQAVEGPLWRAVRGTGLAYGANFTRDIELGQVVFHIFRGTDAAKAVAVTRQLVQDLVSGESSFERAGIEAGISSIINSLVSGQSTPFDAAEQKFTNDVFCNRGENFTQEIMAKIQKVTEEDLKRVTAQYLLPLFNPASSMVFVACHPTMVDALKTYFGKEGYNVTVKPMVGTANDDSEDGSDYGSEYEDESDQRS